MQKSGSRIFSNFGQYFQSHLFSKPCVLAYRFDNKFLEPIPNVDGDKEDIFCKNRHLDLRNFNIKKWNSIDRFSKILDVYYLLDLLFSGPFDPNASFFNLS